MRHFGVSLEGPELVPSRLRAVEINVSKLMVLQSKVLSSFSIACAHLRADVLEYLFENLADDDTLAQYFVSIRAGYSTCF